MVDATFVTACGSAVSATAGTNTLGGDLDMPPPKQPEPQFEYANEPVQNDPWANDVAPKIEFPPNAPPSQAKPPTPNYSMPDYSGQEWGDSNSAPIQYGSEEGRGDLPPDELSVESGPTMDYEPRYAESEYTYLGGGGYTGTGFPVEGGSDEQEGANYEGYDYIAGGGGPGPKTKATPTPLPEDLVDLPPSGMETEAETSPADAFKEGVGTSTTANAAKAAGGALDLLKDTGSALPSSPANMAWNYVYNTIDNSVENNVVNNVVNNETNTNNYNTENNTYNTYNTEENTSTTNNYYYGMGEGAGQVLDTSALLAAIGAAGALAVGAIGALGTTLLGAIAGGAAKGAVSQSSGSGGVGYSAPSAQLLPGEPKSDRYIGFGGGNAPGKNCEQLLQEILQLGGSADELPESCRAKQI